jgi:peptide/nickel transport system permease protein
VVPLLAERLSASLALLGAFALPALLLALALGSPLALRQGGRLDRLCPLLLALFKSLPVFVVAVLLIMLLATSVFTWLPAMSLLDSERSPWAQPRYLPCRR